MKNSLKLILTIVFVLTSCEGFIEIVNVDENEQPAPKEFTVNENDNVNLSFTHTIKVEDSTMVSPAAKVKIQFATGGEVDLLVAFNFIDPNSSEISTTLMELRSENNTQDVSTVFNFLAPDITYGELLNDMEQHQVETDYPFLKEVTANVKMSVGNTTVMNSIFTGGIILLEYGNFPVYVFDCHSVWSLYDFRTFCKVFDDCVRCRTFVWFEGEWRTQQTGFHHCWCLD